MAFSKIRIVSAFFLATACCIATSAADFDHQVKTDDKGNTVFTMVVDQLPLNESEVYDTALKYLQSEYKTARYKDIEQYREKGITVGKSNLNSFYTDNGLTKSEVFSADFYLRIDSKDNKARVQVIFTKYKILKLSDTSNREENEVLISSVAPFADAKDNKRYKKAFEKMQEYVSEIMNSVSQKLKSATPTPASEEW